MPDHSAPTCSSPFQIPIFRWIWIASAASNFGGVIQSVGAAWMMMALVNSPKMVALVQTAMALPIMLMSPIAGAVADNFDRRKVMLAAQGFMLIISATLSFCAYQQMLSPWALLAFTFFIGCGTALNNPAWQASVGDMVPREVLPAAIAYNGMGFNVARSLGPAVGGAIVAAAGASVAFIVNAASYVALILVLLRWKRHVENSPLPRESLCSAIAAGLRYVAMSPHIRLVLARGAMFGLGASSLQAMMPLVARDLVHAGALIFGLLLGCFGLGAVIGAFAHVRLRQRMATETIVRLALLLLVLGTAGMALSRQTVITMTLVAMTGAGWVLALSSFNMSIQMATPRWVVARALALYQTVTFGAMAFGAFSLGLCAQHFGVAVALGSAATALLVALLAGLIWPLQETAELDLTPQGTWQSPDLALDIERRSGPIVITVAHRVNEDDILLFLTAMAERRRIRLRDGARDWTLLRDLAEPELWTECYRFPTWLDYMRNNERRTQNDTANTEALRNLRKAGAEPIVTRMIERPVSSLPVRHGQPFAV